MLASFIINMVLLFLFVSLINMARYMLKIRKVIKMHKDNPNIQGVSIINGKVKIIEKIPSKEQELSRAPKIVTSCCGKEMHPKDAYRVIMKGQEHYFCSWECQEKYRKDQEGV